MKLYQYFYICKHCSEEFTSPCTKNDGEFLLRSDQGELVHLDSMNDRIFKFFSSSIKKELGQKLSESESTILSAALVNDNFGFTCDPSNDGSFYQISNKPLCPSCDNKTFSSWGPIYPPQFTEIEVNSATHSIWNRMSDVQQNIIIKLIVNNQIDAINKCIMTFKYWNMRKFH